MVLLNGGCGTQFGIIYLSLFNLLAGAVMVKMYHLPKVVSINFVKVYLTLIS